jgi:hypothetical protein
MATETDKRGPGFTMNDPDERSEGAGDATIDFATFVLSLGTTALNLPIAQQTIDTLEMLTEKTSGNLTDTESKLLESILYELHLKFVEASK